MQVDLRIVPHENFGAALLYFTGSKEHNVKIRGLAQKQKMTLNEWGLYKLDQYEKAKKETTAKPPPIKPVASESEEAIYGAGTDLHRARDARGPRRGRAGQAKTSSHV